MITYVALLRGINVGGNNLIRMTDLKASFESQGFTDVSTYIQSGNVIFCSEEKDQSRLIETIEKMLSQRFNYTSRVVIRSFEQMNAIVHDAPKGFGKNPDTYRYDVLFVKEPVTADEAIKSISPKEGVDQVFVGKGVIYFSRLTSKATQSRLSRIVSLPIYQSITIRNWNTTTNLQKLME